MDCMSQLSAAAIMVIGSSTGGMAMCITPAHACGQS